MRNDPVLILVRRLDRGGAELLECRLAVQLDRLGYKVFLGAQYGLNDFSGQSMSFEWKRKGVQDVLFLNSKGFLGIVFSIIKVIKWQRLFRFQAIISTNTGLQSLIGIASFFIKIHHVAAFHDYLTPERSSSIRIKLWRRLITRIDAGYAITNYVKQNLCSEIQGLKDKIKVVHNSLDLSKIINRENGNLKLRNELNVPNERKLILYLGRLNYRKGLDIVLDYLGSSLDKWNASIVIAGDSIDSRNLDFGKFDFQSVLDKKIKDLRIEKRVHFLGFRDDVFDVMLQSDVLVHLARHEGFGLILVEALAARLPVVASNVGGMPEVLDSTGYQTFDLLTASKIVREVESLLFMSNVEKEKLTNKGLERLHYFNDERRARDIHSLLQGLMK